MLDPLVIAEAPKDKPLTARDTAAPFTCALCGVEGYAYAWRVNLPNRLGKACTGCAEDKGFEVRFP